MSKPVVKLLLTLSLLCIIPSFLFALTGEEVIQKMDEMATFETSVSTG